MAASILPSPMRLCPMDRCDLSPAKRIAIGPSQHQRPSKCSSIEMVNVESSTSMLSEVDGQDHDSLLSLLRSVPQKDSSRDPSPVLKRFRMYPTLVEVYSSLSSCEPLPAQTAELLEDRSIKRSVYQVIFEVMHRKCFVFTPSCSRSTALICMIMSVISFHLLCFAPLCRPKYHRGNVD